MLDLNIACCKGKRDTETMQGELVRTQTNKGHKEKNSVKVSLTSGRCNYSQAEESVAVGKN